MVTTAATTTTTTTNSNSNTIEGLPSNDVDLFNIDYSDLMILEDQVEVGRGSFGRVLKANYFGTIVAVKVLSSLVTSDPDYNKFMQREIRILKGMRHPNIVMYIGGCKHEDRHMIVTEYISGGDLHHVMKTRPQDLTWQIKIKIALDIASAFSYLHSKQIIFRDLKAKNILIEEANGSFMRAKICDFGFARHLEAKQNRHLTLCGTEVTMAPEVIIGDSYNETCDIYSYGILLYELICGTRTVKNELKRTPEKAFDLDLDMADSYAPSQCPKALLELARICCSYDSKKRPNFKTITLGLTDLASKPIQSLPVKGGTDRSNSSNNNSKQPSIIKFENTDSVIYTGSVVAGGGSNSSSNTTDSGGDVEYGSVIINHDVETKKFPQEALIDYGGNRRNKIMNPSFFTPPSSLNTSLTSSENSGSPPSTLFTSLSISEIRYREPSVYEDPDDIIQQKRKHLSTPNLPKVISPQQQDSPTTGTVLGGPNGGLAQSWHPKSEVEKKKKGANKKKNKSGGHGGAANTNKPKK